MRISTSTGREMNAATFIQTFDGNVQVMAASSRGGRHTIIRGVVEFYANILDDAKVTWTAKELESVRRSARRLLADVEERIEQEACVGADLAGAAGGGRGNATGQSCSWPS